jgi:hypothetical protein
VRKQTPEEREELSRALKAFEAQEQGIEDAMKGCAIVGLIALVVILAIIGIVAGLSGLYNHFHK